MNIILRFNRLRSVLILMGNGNLIDNQAGD